jgi:heptosyltransferase-2
VVVLGAPADAPLGAAIAGAAPGRVADLCGATTLRQTAALLRRCAVAVSNDTGLMHLAAAAAPAVVALFGPSDYRRFGAWKEHTLLTLDLPCSPAGGAQDVGDRCARCRFDRPYCMHDLDVERVRRAVLQILQPRHAPSAS